MTSERRSDKGRLSWLRALRQARAGNPDRLIYLLCVPQQEIGTDKLDARGARIWRQTFLALPDDSWLRGLIVEALLRGLPKVPGKKPAVDRFSAVLIRMVHAHNRRDGMTNDASRESLCKFHGLTRGTLDDIIDQRHTYAQDYVPHEMTTKRQARKKSQ